MLVADQVSGPVDGGYPGNGQVRGAVFLRLLGEPAVKAKVA